MKGRQLWLSLTMPGGTLVSLSRQVLDRLASTLVIVGENYFRLESDELGR
jgi:hypothetical protein